MTDRTAPDPARVAGYAQLYGVEAAAKHFGIPLSEVWQSFAKARRRLTYSRMMRR